MQGDYDDAFGDSNLIVRAIRQGAYNYLDKPFPLDAAMNMAEHAFESIRFLNRSALPTATAICSALPLQ